MMPLRLVVAQRPWPAALEPAERDVVLGDLAESGEGVGAATRNLLGLNRSHARSACGCFGGRGWRCSASVSGRAFVESNRVPPQRRSLTSTERTTRPT